MIRKLFKLFFEKTITLLFCLLWSNTLLADTRIEVTSTAADTIYFTMHDWPDEDWVAAPSLCQRSCLIGMQISPGNGEPASGQFITDSGMTITGAKTMGDISRAWKARYGLGGSFYVGVPTTALSRPNMCLGMKFNVGGGKIGLLPGLTCLGYSPGIPATFCYIQEGTINLNHRTVESSVLEGNIAQASTNIRCTLPANVVLRMANLTNSQLYLNSERTLYSTIRINGSPVSNGVNMRVDTGGINYSIDFSSTLGSSSQNITTGQYSGSSVMIVDFQ